MESRRDVVVGVMGEKMESRRDVVVGVMAGLMSTSSIMSIHRRDGDDDAPPASSSQPSWTSKKISHLLHPFLQGHVRLPEVMRDLGGGEILLNKLPHTVGAQQNAHGVSRNVELVHVGNPAQSRLAMRHGIAKGTGHVQAGVHLAWGGDRCWWLGGTMVRVGPGTIAFLP